MHHNIFVLFCVLLLTEVYYYTVSTAYGSFMGSPTGKTDLKKSKAWRKLKEEGTVESVYLQ